MLYFQGGLLQSGEVGSKDLHTQLRSDAGGEHEHAALNRLQESGHRTGEISQCGGHFGDEPFTRHARAPFALRLQHDRGLDHLGRRGIRGGVGTPQLADGAAHFRETSEHLILPGHGAFHFIQ